ncbi:hypothetical protein J2W35_001701 [Variovorax boronicumulans]|uniref:hypothetical protein n=1 Tax=Variovorax boronicumulans TaxID=436515 RepID=UPI00277DF96E|nr:hypothetical protein [Variovorax boronicumulans]MDQ0081362.1 hypothetical protein [Variovorax boronicumulans]
MFTVRVLGFGDEPASGGTGEVRGAAATKVGYDANSPVQLLGRGALGEAQKAKFTARERQLLGQ